MVLIAALIKISLRRRFFKPSGRRAADLFFPSPDHKLANIPLFFSSKIFSLVKSAKAPRPAVRHARTTTGMSAGGGLAGCSDYASMPLSFLSRRPFKAADRSEQEPGAATSGDAGSPGA